MIPSYLDLMTHKSSKTFDVLGVGGEVETAVLRWLQSIKDQPVEGRRVIVTFQLEPTDEQRQKAADAEYFDDEYS